MDNFPIKQRIVRLVKRWPGLTACAYAKLLRHPSKYASASVLRQLHREFEAGRLERFKEPGQRPSVKAWRFYFHL